MRREFVRGTNVVILHLNRLYRHHKGTLRVVNIATGPLDGSRWIGGVTGSPRTNFQLHGGLWVKLRSTGGCIVGRQKADKGTVNVPVDATFLPINNVRMCRRVRIAHIMYASTVISPRVSFAIPIRLYLIRLRAQPLQIDFVQRV